MNALIRYHERRIAESKKSIKRQKRPTGTVNKKSKYNKNTHEQNVKEIAENFFKKFNEFKNLMNTMSNKSGEQSACLLISPTYITRVYRKTTNCQNQAVKSVKNAKPQKHKLIKEHN